MQHTMKLQSKYFYKVKEKTKTYEVRLCDEKRQQINLGDTILFQNQSNLDEQFTTKVVDIIRFNTFEEMAKTLDFVSIGFENSSMVEVVETYHSFYSQEDEKKYGVVSFKLEVL